ncbi:MAG: hypothetical protein HUJ53_01445 [Holdemanella sp.]|nr:hypothetical protein [Holdemanella sp.]
MTRQETLKQIYAMAVELTKNYTFDLNKQMWDLASDWNASHDSSEEIFLCDDENGFYVEDDRFEFQD